MPPNVDTIANTEPRTIEITVHCCMNIPPKLAFGVIKKKREYYVQVILGSERKQTKTAQRLNEKLEWDQKLTFDNIQTSSMTFSLYYRRTWRNPNLVQQLTYPLSDLGGDFASSAILQTASFPNGSYIEFSIEIHSAIEQAKQALGSLAQRTPKDGWKRLLSGIESFHYLVQDVAEVHPYAKLARTLLFAVPGPLIEQLELDEDVQTLFDSFASFCDIVHELENSGIDDSGKIWDILKRISLQMIEVAYFVRDYCKEENFLKKALRNKFSGVSDAIQEYHAKIEELKDEFHTRLAVQTSRGVIQTKIKVMRVFRELEAIGQSIDLNDIPYVSGAGLNTDKRCLEGTREKFLEEIEDWINSDGPRTLLIIGGAGTGKSSIAHTIAARFKELGRLGSVFCFSEDEKATRKPTSLFSHMARDLADLDPHIRAELAKAAEDKADRTTSGITAQFENLVLIPANAIREHLHGPVVIVTDALDESGPVVERQILLRVLANRLKELPPNFRFIITSRPDPDIEDAFKPNFDILIKKMHDIPSESTSADITAYIKTQLAGKPDMNDEKCQELASHAHDLFQWASVACQYICSASAGETLLDRFEELTQPLAHNTGEELVGDDLLDYLYRAVLSKVLSTKRKAAMLNFRFVMARVLTAFEPLSCRSLNRLVRASKVAPKGCIVENVVKYLGSLLSGVDDQNTPIRPLHTSFRNYLANSSRSRDFFVDLGASDVHSDMALASMRIMDNELSFNICQLKCSHLPNKEIPNIEGSIKKYIPRHLSYACRFWAAHVISLPVINSGRLGVKSLATVNRRDEITEEVGQLLRARLLYCLEVLSLECAVKPGLEQMQGIRGWFKKSGMDEGIILLVDDAENFFSYFSKCIATSVPHIYISALPFTPNGSLVAENYGQHRNKTLALTTGQLEKYPSWPPTLLGHTGAVKSVGFSPDGTRIVSGSWDKTIRVWSVENSEMVVGPLEGHTSEVMSVGFSPDGTRIVSGSCDHTIRVWNAENGEIIIGPLRGHTHFVYSVGFSPDGTRVVSGSDDNTIRVWNVEDGEIVVGPLQGHTDWVRSVQFSPDGTRIVSGSKDKTIRVWNAENGEMVLGPLQGHIDLVNLVRFSPNGTFMVSGSTDKTIRVWNAENGEMVIGPLHGHTNAVNSVEFSPDGTRIVSGSQDYTIRVWNAESGEMAIRPLAGHTNSVSSVRFSHNGSRVVSGSFDNTIRVWNVESSETNIGPLEGHTAMIHSVKFSPDCARIVSGSADKTIRVWNAENGEVVIGPLQGHAGEVNSVGFSPDGALIVSGSDDKTIRVWNAENGEVMIGPLEGHTSEVVSVVFSSDGKRIASGSCDSTVRVWSTETGEMITGPFEGHTDRVWSVAFSPDGTRIVSGSADKTIRLWNVGNGEMAIGPLEGHTGVVASVDFSPDGTRIVSGSADNTIRLWNAENGEMVVGPLIDHTGVVNSVEFSQDGTRIVSGSYDNTIRVWDARNGTLILGPLQTHSSGIISVGFSPDGTRLVSGSFDKTIRIQSLPQSKDLPNDFLKASTPYHPSQATHVGIENGLNSKPLLDDCDDRHRLVPQNHWRIEDGWSLGPDGELLFYVPPAHRAHLYHPNTLNIVGTEIPTKLDMTRFIHGTRWTESFDSGAMSGNHK